MSFDSTALLLSLVVSSIGFVAFTYGRKQARPPPLVAGLVLMIFPYFISNAWIIAAIALAVLGVLWLAVRLGW